MSGARRWRIMLLMLLTGMPEMDAERAFAREARARRRAAPGGARDPARRDRRDRRAEPREAVRRRLPPQPRRPLPLAAAMGGGAPRRRTAADLRGTRRQFV